PRRLLTARFQGTDVDDCVFRPLYPYSTLAEKCLQSRLQRRQPSPPGRPKVPGRPQPLHQPRRPALARFLAPRQHSLAGPKKVKTEAPTKAITGDRDTGVRRG